MRGSERNWKMKVKFLCFILLNLDSSRFIKLVTLKHNSSQNVFPPAGDKASHNTLIDKLRHFYKLSSSDNFSGKRLACVLIFLHITKVGKAVFGEKKFHKNPG